jgi:hypothetical protein
MPGRSPIVPADESGSLAFVDALFVQNCREWVSFEPQRASGDIRIDTNLIPPCSFITRTMDLAMMSSAQRDSKLIAHLAAQRAVLHKAQMMGIRRSATANQTGLTGHMSNVLAVANPTRLRQCQYALIDYGGSLSFFASNGTALYLRLLRFLRHHGSV